MSDYTKRKCSKVEKLRWEVQGSFKTAHHYYIFKKNDGMPETHKECADWKSPQYPQIQECRRCKEKFA
jgi:hypothetical protein